MNRSCQLNYVELLDLADLRLPCFFLWAALLAAFLASALRPLISAGEYMEPRQLAAPQ